METETLRRRWDEVCEFVEHLGDLDISERHRDGICTGWNGVDFWVVYGIFDTLMRANERTWAPLLTAWN